MEELDYKVTPKDIENVEWAMEKFVAVGAPLYENKGLNEDLEELVQDGK